MIFSSFPTNRAEWYKTNKPLEMNESVREKKKKKKKENPHTMIY